MILNGYNLLHFLCPASWTVVDNGIWTGNWKHYTHFTHSWIQKIEGLANTILLQTGIIFCLLFWVNTGNWSHVKTNAKNVLCINMYINYLKGRIYMYSTGHNFWYSILLITSISMLMFLLIDPDADFPNADPGWN